MYTQSALMSITLLSFAGVDFLIALLVSYDYVSFSRASQ